MNRRRRRIAEKEINVTVFFLQSDKTANLFIFSLYRTTKRHRKKRAVPDVDYYVNKWIWIWLDCWEGYVENTIIPPVWDRECRGVSVTLARSDVRGILCFRWDWNFGGESRELWIIFDSATNSCIRLSRFDLALSIFAKKSLFYNYNYSNFGLW